MPQWERSGNGAPNLWNRKRGGALIQYKGGRLTSSGGSRALWAAEPSEMAPEVAFVVAEVPGSRGCGPRVLRKKSRPCPHHAQSSSAAATAPGPLALGRSRGLKALGRAGEDAKKVRNFLQISDDPSAVMTRARILHIQLYRYSTVSCTVMTVKTPYTVHLKKKNHLVCHGLLTLNPHNFRAIWS